MAGVYINGDEIEVVSGASLPVPSGPNYSLFGYEGGNAIKVSRGAFVDTLVDEGRCISGRISEISDSTITLETSKIKHGDIFSMKTALKGITIDGTDNIHAYVFFVASGSSLTIKSSVKVYKNISSFVANESYLAEIISVQGQTKAYIINFTRVF